MYEKSYMHRDVVTHVAVSPADFFITGSADGHLKFWKKKPSGIEFAKHFRSHLSPIEGLAVSVDGLLCCTISNDRSVKIYDVVNYDMMFMMRLPFVPGAIEWVYRQGDVKPKLAVSDRNTSFVHVYDTHSGSNDPIISKEIHSGPVKVMKYNHAQDVVVSADAKGLLEYWFPSTLKFPEEVSPAAEAVFRNLVSKRGLESKFLIDSAGTIGYHEGNKADSRMTSASKKRGIEVTSISRPIKPSDFRDFDLILAMDRQNYEDVLSSFERWQHKEPLPDSGPKKVKLMCSYCKRHTESEVPDPYYGDAKGFEKVLDLLEDACESLLDDILAGNANISA